MFRNLSLAGLDDERARRWQQARDYQMRAQPFSRDDLRMFLKKLFRPVSPDIDPLSVVRWKLVDESAAVDVSINFYSRSAYEAMPSGFTHR